MALSRWADGGDFFENSKKHKQVKPTVENPSRALPKKVAKEEKAKAKGSDMMPLPPSSPFNWADEVEVEDEMTPKEVKVKGRGKTTYWGWLGFMGQ